MERYCGYLQNGLRSRSEPWANLNRRILDKAYIEQIDIYYDLEDIKGDKSGNHLRRGETIIPDCESTK